MRSKMYYGRARVMSVLPLFLPMDLDRLSVNAKETIKTMLLNNLVGLLQTRSSPRKDGKPGYSAAKLAASVLEKIIAEETLCIPSYFARVWTLSGELLKTSQQSSTKSTLSYV